MTHYLYSFDCVLDILTYITFLALAVRNGVRLYVLSVICKISRTLQEVLTSNIMLQESP